jgi:hypothetical protein
MTASLSALWLSAPPPPFRRVTHSLILDSQAALHRIKKRSTGFGRGVGREKPQAAQIQPKQRDIVIPNQVRAVQKCSVATKRNQDVRVPGHLSARPAREVRRRPFAVVVNENGVDPTDAQAVRQRGG